MSNPVPRIEGGPIWMDLGTHDIDAAISFYSDVFGWQFEDTGAEFGHYRMIRSGGAAIGGAMSTLVSPEGPLEEPHSPSAWGVYLLTADIEDATQRAQAAGAGVLFPPMPVGQLGSMALLSDPSGAAVGFWQPGEFPGIEDTSAPGLPVWFELMTTDFDAATTFYTDVLQWELGWMNATADPHEMPAYTSEPPADAQGMRYVVHNSAAGPVAGMCEANAWLPEGTPSFWRMYVGVEDTDATIKALLARGGTVLDGPMDSPFGRVATVADPQGASFQITSVPPRS